LGKKETLTLLVSGRTRTPDRCQGVLGGSLDKGGPEVQSPKPRTRRQCGASGGWNNIAFGGGKGEIASESRRRRPEASTWFGKGIKHVSAIRGRGKLVGGGPEGKTLQVNTKGTCGVRVI